MSKVGAKGLDTPAERDFLKGFDSDNGVMDVATNFKNETRDYDFDVDGKTQGYTFTGDAPLTPEAIQRMRDMQNITADGDLIKNLGIGARGLNTPAEREKLAAIMGMGAHPDKMSSFMDTGVLPEGYLQKYGVGARGVDTRAEKDFLNNNFAGTGEANMDVDRASFNTNFQNLTPEQKARVTEMMAGMTPEQKKAFALGMTGKEGQSKLGGYEVNNQNRLAY